MKRVIISIAAVLFLSTGFAQIPGTLSYQGILVTGAGAPVTDGAHTVSFKFYTVAAGGTAVFTRGPFTVVTYKGMFTFVLGTTTPTGNDPLPVLATDPNYIGGSQYYVELFADNERESVDLVEPAGQAEVADLRSAIFERSPRRVGQEDVAGLDIAVDDPRLVSRMDGPRQGADERRRRAGTLGRSAESLRQIAALGVLHHEIGPGRPAADLVDLDDVRVLEAGDRLGLGAESRDDIRVEAGCGVDRLESDHSPQSVLPGLIDDAHSPSADLFKDRVTRHGRENDFNLCGGNVFQDSRQGVVRIRRRDRLRLPGESGQAHQDRCDRAVRLEGRPTTVWAVSDQRSRPLGHLPTVPL